MSHAALQTPFSPPAPVAHVHPRGRWAFALFLLVNAALFLRPGDLTPSLESLPIYELLILSCLALAVPQLLAQLRPAALRQQPISALVVAMLLMVALSHLARGALDSAIAGIQLFGKVLLYFLLLMALVDSPRRLRTLLLWLLGCTLLAGALPIAQKHGLIDLPGLTPLLDRQTDPETGAAIRFERLRGVGIFADPNDLCQILDVGVVLCFYALSQQRRRWARGLWLLPVGLLLYGIMLTQSRGGFIGLLAGLGVLFLERWGWKKTLAAGILALPAMLLLFKGRQMELSVGSATGQERVQVWSDALLAFRQNPLFGVGQGNFGGNGALVAHNSFLQCYAELGFFGGTFFLGAFYLALRQLRDLRPHEHLIGHQTLRVMRPYLLAMLAAYAAAMMSLTRSYLVPTYLMLGLSGAFLACVAASSPLALPRFGGRMLRHLFLIGAACIAATFVFVRLAVRW